MDPGGCSGAASAMLGSACLTLYLSLMVLQASIEHSYWCCHASQAAPAAAAASGHAPAAASSSVNGTAAANGRLEDSQKRRRLAAQGRADSTPEEWDGIVVLEAPSPEDVSKSRGRPAAAAAAAAELSAAVREKAAAAERLRAAQAELAALKARIEGREARIAKEQVLSSERSIYRECFQGHFSVHGATWDS